MLDVKPKPEQERKMKKLVPFLLPLLLSCTPQQDITEQRFLSLHPSITETIFYFGKGAKLYGYNDFDLIEFNLKNIELLIEKNLIENNLIKLVYLS